MATGDTVRSGGVEYEIVWSGAKTDPSLLDDYSRPSTLTLVSQSPPPTRHRSERTPTRHRRTYAQAKAEMDVLFGSVDASL
ncbi:MAG TPA: hypothetical protein VNJ04_12105 [Gemmatimonadaceae bacterium]|nr:hypothetical protein [Gemmatimonadaceae bacterium]